MEGEKKDGKGREQARESTERNQRLNQLAED